MRESTRRRRRRNPRHMLLPRRPRLRVGAPRRASRCHTCQTWFPHCHPTPAPLPLLSRRCGPSSLSSWRGWARSVRRAVRPPRSLRRAVHAPRLVRRALEAPRAMRRAFHAPRAMRRAFHAPRFASRPRGELRANWPRSRTRSAGHTSCVVFVTRMRRRTCRRRWWTARGPPRWHSTSARGRTCRLCSRRPGWLMTNSSGEFTPRGLPGASKSPTG